MFLFFKLFINWRILLFLNFTNFIKSLLTYSKAYFSF